MWRRNSAADFREAMRGYRAGEVMSPSIYRAVAQYFAESPGPSKGAWAIADAADRRE
jgi:hypothetical protein